MVLHRKIQAFSNSPEIYECFFRNVLHFDISVSQRCLQRIVNGFAWWNSHGMLPGIPFFVAVCCVPFHQMCYCSKMICLNLWNLLREGISSNALLFSLCSAQCCYCSPLKQAAASAWLCSASGPIIKEWFIRALGEKLIVPIGVLLLHHVNCIRAAKCRFPTPSLLWLIINKLASPHYNKAQLTWLWINVTALTENDLRTSCCFNSPNKALVSRGVSE